MQLTSYIHALKNYSNSLENYIISKNMYEEALRKSFDALHSLIAEKDTLYIYKNTLRAIEQSITEKYSPKDNCHTNDVHADFDDDTLLSAHFRENY